MAGKIVLYGFPISPYVQRTVMTLNEVGIEEFASIPTNTIKGENKEPEFLELNPLGKIPVYQDGDVTMFESRAIARYLFEKFPEKGGELMGRDVLERADVNKWIDVEMTSYNLAVAPIIGETLIPRVTGQPVDEARLKESVQKLSDLLDVYEKHLASSGGFLACGRVTFADLTHLPFTALLKEAGYEGVLTSRPNVAKWWNAISTRPSWVKVWDGPTIPKVLNAPKTAA